MITDRSPLLAAWAKDNTNFRRVVYTTAKKQWVLMSIPPGGEIGEETHGRVTQTFYFVSGRGVALIGDQITTVRPGIAVTVFPGTRHNFQNVGKGPLKLYTVYEPPNHIDGRVQKTKRAADRDTADEAFGRRVERGRR
jgi:mannose-6-phosphate isomerase-like protein (cupin superfamily)